MRDFTGLLKLAGLEKKADLPHRGLNDDNPAKKYIYQKYGYIPQMPGSYLGGANTPREFKRAFGDAMKFSQNQLGIKKLDKAAPEQQAEHRARIGDYLRSAGATPGLSSYYPGDKAGGNGFVWLGSYPMSEDALKHELGHAADFSRRPDQNISRMDREVAAWDNAGIPEGDKLRDVSLDTYRNLDKLDSIMKYRKWFTGPFTRVKGVQGIVKDNQEALSRAFDEHRKRYAHPNTYIQNYKSDVPIAYDYKSFQDIAHKGLLDNVVLPQNRK